MKNKFSVIVFVLGLMYLVSVNGMLDTQPPEIKDVCATPNPQIPGGYVNITCVVIDNVEVDTVKVNITYPDASYYNITMYSLQPKPYVSPTHYYNNTYTMEGTYYYYIWANDTSGNSVISSTYSFNITSDTTPPETYILSGPSGNINYHNVTFEWIGSDDITPTNKLVYSYKLEGYDLSWSSWTSQTSKTYYNLPDGSYTFKVKARDEAGNVDPTPANRSFNIKSDVCPPLISNVNDYPDPQVVGGFVNISCVVTDDVEVATVKVIIKYPDCRTMNITMNHIPCEIYYYNTTYCIAGTYYYYIWAVDTSGNTAKSPTYTFKIISDNTPPVISNIIDYPDPQNVGGFVNISCIVTDNVKVNIVKVFITYPDSSVNAFIMHQINGKYYFNNTYTMEGTYYYYIWANDTSGNSATSSTYSFNIKEVDGRPPQVFIERPRRFLYIADREIIPTLKPIIIGGITIKVFATDYETGIEKVEFYIDGMLKRVDTTSPYVWLWNERAIGNYIISVIAYDKAGNTNSDWLLIFIINF